MQKKLEINSSQRVNVEMTEPMQFLESIYQEAIAMKDIREAGLTKTDGLGKCYCRKRGNAKGSFTVTFTSLTYKCLHPEQDVRLHQANMEGGYSGRTFDTKYVTPFLKSKRFYGAMKESGWLTRSLEQNIPYHKDFPGKISIKSKGSIFKYIR